MNKGSPNPPTQLVSIALNTLPCKQKADVAGELMKRGEKMKKPSPMQEIMSTQKLRQKKL